MCRILFPDFYAARLVWWIISLDFHLIAGLLKLRIYIQNEMQSETFSRVDQHALELASIEIEKLEMPWHIISSIFRNGQFSKVHGQMNIGKKEFN